MGTLAISWWPWGLYLSKYMDLSMVFGKVRGNGIETWTSRLINHSWFAVRSFRVLNVDDFQSCTIFTTVSLLVALCTLNNTTPWVKFMNIESDLRSKYMLHGYFSFGPIGRVKHTFTHTLSQRGVLCVCFLRVCFSTRGLRGSWDVF